VAKKDQEVARAPKVSLRLDTTPPPIAIHKQPGGHPGKSRGNTLKNLILVAAALAAVSAAPATAGDADFLIDFEELADGNRGTNVLAYPEATFTGTGILFVNGAGVGKDLCTLGTLGCNGTMTITFVGPAKNLSFTTVGDNLAASLFITLGFESGDPVDLVRPLDGNTFVKDFHDLTGYSGITSVKLFSDDLAGLAYDDFRFTIIGGTADVPEPATWALLITGFGLIGAALRRAPKEPRGETGSRRRTAAVLA
jgi:hypothetical protein